MDETDRRIVNALQGGFPVCDEPFAAVAETLGIGADELIGRLRALLETGVLSRFGPQLPHMAEAALVAANTPSPPPERRRMPRWAYALGGALVGAALVVLGSLL